MKHTPDDEKLRERRQEIVLGGDSIGGFIEDLYLGSACLLLPECLRETK